MHHSISNPLWSASETMRRISGIPKSDMKTLTEACVMA